MEISKYIKRSFMSWLPFLNKDNLKTEQKSKVKFGYDKNGMPFIDMSDRETAQVFKKKLEAFRGIKTY